MSKIREILESSKKPKEILSLVSESVKKDPRLIKELMDCFKTGSDVDKGTCAHAMKLISADKPEIFKPYIKNLIGYINYKAPRVKWGIPETIGNLAKKYPKEVESAVPKLLLNTNDESTVVRWCAAFGICEILKYNTKIQKEVTPKIRKIIVEEKNNGVRNVYVKALKEIEKESK